MVVWGRAPLRGAGPGPALPLGPAGRKPRGGSDEEVGPARTDAERWPGAAAPVCSEWRWPASGTVQAQFALSGRPGLLGIAGRITHWERSPEEMVRENAWVSWGRGRGCAFCRFGEHTHVLTISSALGVQGQCLRPRALLLVVLLKLFNRNETEQPLWASLFI